MSDYRGTKVLVNDNLVRLERILNYTGVGLERFDCIELCTYKICNYSGLTLYFCTVHGSL